MFRKLLAWSKLIKLGSVKGLRKEVDTFYRGNIIKVLKKEGWFEFLQEPHTVEEIAKRFGYTDTFVLNKILKTLAGDDTLKKTVDQKYAVNEPLDESWVSPSLLHESLQTASIQDAEFLPRRLKGEFLEFSADLKLFSWEDAFRADTSRGKLYIIIREAGFVFAGLPKTPCKLLNVGCGAGYETAHIWWEYFRKGFIPHEEMKIYAVDPEADFINIANVEFPMMLADISDIKNKPATFFNKFRRSFPTTGFTQIIENISESPVAFFEAYKKYFPQFSIGDTINLKNFKDETFDTIFFSQVLHWTDTEKALKELFRVLKPGGFIIGTNNFYPNADPYSDLHLQVIKGATGYIHVENFKKIVRENGGRKLAIATPISVFWIRKRI